jgi:hypothetical protein
MHHLLIAASGIVALVVGWAAVQGLVRRESPEMDRETDVLSCGLCGTGGRCVCGLKAYGARGEHGERSRDD